MTRTKSQDHITPILQSLHWLPVSKWIEYKILCLTYWCVRKAAPQYLQELVSPHNAPCSLHSSSLCRLSVSEFGENTNKKMFRSKVIPQCCTHPLEQAARQASPSKRHCFFSAAAAEITFVFNFATSSPSPHPLPHIFLPLSSYLPPPTHTHTPTHTPLFSIFFAKCHEHVVSCTESDCTLQVNIDVDSA